ncbi:hypothetical protein DIURU_000595 [Diutina rugosa]|uniref:Hyphally-regulated cell wall protein N-terminal domain-containing protein n=1 Tax=Diutina rugosa TaxID=5481 RepID=A0A642UXI4_DIURU|nr:uncharacterized protein DIURU_000595 [Diutina rugosa]KAA8907275.1 hypothetical protein DIURU_000595 [Diutina rugosa]
MRLSIAALSAIASVVAADKLFGAIIIRSGSKFQYGSLDIAGDAVHVNDKDGDKIENFRLLEDGTLQDDATKKFIVIGDNGDVEVADEGKPGWSVDGDHLSYSAHGFEACPTDGEKYFLHWSDNVADQCEGGTGLSIRALDVHDVASENKDDEGDKQDNNDNQQQQQQQKEDQNPPAFEQKDGFGLVAIHSGTDFQNQPIKKDDAHPHVFSVGGSAGRDLTLILKDDGTLVDQNGRGVFVGNNGDVGNVDPWGEQQATGGFSVKDGNLYFNNEQSFYACPGGPNSFSLTVKGWDGCTGLQLKVFQ